MKLNRDCVRDLLLTIEEVYKVDDVGNSNRLLSLSINKHPRLARYSHAEILYTCQKLVEAGYLECQKLWLDNEVGQAYYDIQNMTFQGHEYLDTIRDQDS